MPNYPTPHINATPKDFARTVLMPGDPMRSKFIAENFLENSRLINNIRGIQGYTGTYRSVPVTVMASGMGMPSMGIYSWELFNVFGVENIIRIGTAGAIADDVKLRDIVFGIGASTDSNYGHQFGLTGTFAPTADYKLLRTAVNESEKLGIGYRVGNILSSDNFYSVNPNESEQWVKMGIIAIEMEAAALYMNAAFAKKHALAICTVSDHIIKGERLDAKSRESTFTDMIKIALETAVAAQNIK